MASVGIEKVFNVKDFILPNKLDIYYFNIDNNYNRYISFKREKYYKWFTYEDDDFKENIINYILQFSRLGKLLIRDPSINNDILVEYYNAKVENDEKKLIDIKQKYKQDYDIFEKFWLNGFQYPFEINEETFNKLYDNAEESKVGKINSYEIDKNVRLSKEISNIENIDLIENKLKDWLIKKNINIIWVKFHKVILYKKDGFFHEHADAKHQDNHTHTLVIYPGETGITIGNKYYDNDIILFKREIAHKVPKVKNFKITFTFDVCINNFNEESIKLNKSIIRKWIDKFKIKKIGFFSSSIDDKELDNKLAELFEEEMGCKREIIDVVETTYGLVRKDISKYLGIDYINNQKARRNDNYSGSDDDDDDEIPVYLINKDDEPDYKSIYNFEWIKDEYRLGDIFLISTFNKKSDLYNPYEIYLGNSYMNYEYSLDSYKIYVFSV